MAAIWTKPSALPPTSFNNILSNAVWDTYGKELVGTSVVVGSYNIPGAGLGHGSQPRSRVIRVPAGASTDDQYWIIVKGFLAMNGQALDSTVSQTKGNLTLTPLNAATGLGAASYLLSSPIGGTLGKRCLNFEPIYEPKTGEYFVVITPMSTNYATAAKATAGDLSGATGPGILHSVIITTTGDADDAWTAIYDGSGAPVSTPGSTFTPLIARIPPRNQETLVKGVGTDANRIFHYNVPFVTGLHYGGDGFVAAATNGPAITVTFSCNA